MSKTFRTATVVALALMLPVGYAQAETADEFVARINKEFADIWLEGNAAGWTQATYINVDTELLNARATERWLAAFSKAVEEAKAFDGQPMSAASKRAIELSEAGRAGARAEGSGEARRARDAARRAWRASTARPSTASRARTPAATRRSSRPCSRRAATTTSCSTPGRAGTTRRSRCAPITSASSSSRTRARASSVTRTSVRCGARVTTCRPTSSPRRPRGSTRRSSRSTRTCSAMRAAGCAKKYGEDKVPGRQADPGAPARQHVGAAVGRATTTCSSRTRASATSTSTAALVKQGYDAVRMAKSAEAFYKSIALPALPETFWERSMLTQPRDRDVAMPRERLAHGRQGGRAHQECIRPTYEELRTHLSRDGARLLLPLVQGAAVPVPERRARRLPRGDRRHDHAVDDAGLPREDRARAGRARRARKR